MTTVWIVWDDAGADYSERISAIFSTEEKANDYADWDRKDLEEDGYEDTRVGVTQWGVDRAPKRRYG